MKKEEGLSENSLIETEQYELIESKIFMCRDMPVMLDSDVADFFGVEVKRLNQQMNRNKNRFPEDFCFQLNSNEFKNLRCQNVITKSDTILRSQNATANHISFKRRFFI